MNKITKINNITIYDNDYILKEEKNLIDLENYLKSRNYEGFIPILDRINNKNKYKYINNYSINDNQLGMDVINNIALLHNKTSYKKTISTNKNKEIYDNLNGYIKYLSDYYISLLKEYEYIEFPSPSNLLYMANYTKINQVLIFVKRELDLWYKLVENKTNERTSLIHNNLKLEHAIYNDQLYLTSWRKARFDTPILDFINFYHNEWNNINFEPLLEQYLKKCELLEEEKKLLYINLLIPEIPIIKNKEIDNIINISKLFKYIYKTEELTRPYYSKQDNEEKK